MSIIILFSILTLLWPIAMVVMIGKKHIIKYIVLTFIVFFIGTNSIHSFHTSLTIIRILFSLLIIISVAPMFYIGYKRKCWTRTNLKESFGWLWSLYLIITVATIIRLFINHMNSDTLAYARNSIYIREGTLAQHGLPFWYQTPTFYHAAALIEHPVDFFTIYGEVLQVTLFSIALNAIVREIKNKKTLSIVIISVLVSVASIYALSYKTSGVNWSSVSIALLFIFASRKNIYISLLIPFALSTFSFSPMLSLPLALFFVVMKRKWTLKEIVMIVSIVLSSSIFMGMNILNVSYKLFNIITLLAILNSVLYFIKWNELKTFDNKIYSIKLEKLNTLKSNKKYKIVAITFASVFLVFIEIFMALMIKNVINFPLIVTAKETAMMTIIPIGIYVLSVDAIYNNKVSQHLWWVIALVGIMLTYFIMQLVPGVASYTVERIALPFAICIILMAILRVLEIQWETRSKKIVVGTTVGVLSMCNVGLMIGDFLPSTIYSPISASIEMNYKFVTSGEQRDALNNRQKGDVIYSDVALSSIRSIWDEGTYFTNQMRGMYFAEMKDRMAGMPSIYWDSLVIYKNKYEENPAYYDHSKGELTTTGKKEFKKDVDAGIIIKKAAEFAGLSDSIDILSYSETRKIPHLNSTKSWWEQWDAKNVFNTNKNAKNVNVFMFRRKRYFDLVIKHYGSKVKTTKTTDNLYIVRLK